MARTYQRQKYPGWNGGRMLRAVQLRAEGKSLRQIAAVLKVSHQTVANDLARLAGRPPALQFDPEPGCQYRKTMRATTGECQMCSRDGDREVDHCHRHGRVRGLVCLMCNMSMRTVDAEPGEALLAVDHFASYARRCPDCAGRVDRVSRLLRDTEGVQSLVPVLGFRPPTIEIVRAAYEQVRPLLSRIEGVA